MQLEQPGGTKNGRQQKGRFVLGELVKEGRNVVSLFDRRADGD